MQTHVLSRAYACDRFQWAYQQLVDLRYEWAVPSDARAKPSPGSPAPDTLYYLPEDELSSNASARPAGSLQYYIAALEQDALNATNQLFVAGAAPAPQWCCAVI